MSTALEEIAATVESRLTHLAQKEATIEADLFKTRKEKSAMHDAANRIKLLRTSNQPLPIDTCLNCHILHGIDSKMKAVPSDTENDLFRCGVCGYEKEVRP